MSTPPRAGPLAALALLLALLLAAPACRPLFIPLVPATIAPSPRFELDATSRLWWDGGRLRADLIVAEVPEPGWLAVQWLTPSGREVASDSVWVEANGVGGTFTLVAPPAVDQVGETGRWSAVVSFGSELVRQLSTAPEGAPAGDDTDPPEAPPSATDPA
jgi:hypothetical protein